MQQQTHPNILIGDELIVAVFSEFPTGQKLNFKDESYIMHAFYSASKNSKYSILFENYSFDEDGIIPYSREISEGLSNLHQADLFGKWNPSFTFYQFSAGIKHRFSKYIDPKLDATQKQLIKDLAEDIKGELLSN